MVEFSTPTSYDRMYNKRGKPCDRVWTSYSPSTGKTELAGEQTQVVEVTRKNTGWKEKSRSDTRGVDKLEQMSLQQ